MKTIVRVSSLAGWPDCPRRGAARLFRPEIEAAGFRLRRTLRGIGAMIGTAVHEAAKFSLGEKARSGLLPPVYMAEDAARDRLRYQMSSGGEVLFDSPRGVTHSQRAAEHQTLSMVRAYHQHVAPQIEPVMVEERLEAEVQPGVILSGQSDVVAREPHAIRDLKTGTRGPGTFAAQIGGYALLARTHAIDIAVGRVDYIRRVATTAPQPLPESRAIEVERAETAAASILRHIIGDLDTFRRGDPERRFLPGDPWAFQANPSSMLCSPKYCSAYGTEFCREGEAGK